MTESHPTQHLTLIVDGVYLFHVPGDVLGRPPAPDERVDLDRLKRHAASMRPAGYFVDARYFDHRRRNADSFYSKLEHLSYTPTLSSNRDYDSPQPAKDNILAELDSLRATDHDILYVGGYSYNGKLTAALNNLRKRPDGSPRSITIAHFERSTDFDNEGFPLLDIVNDINAVPSHVYADAYETALGAALQAARETVADAQSHDEVPDQPALSRYPPGYLEANQGFRPDSSADERPPTDESPPEPEPTPQPPETPNIAATSPAKPRSLLVLIDLENIDGALADLIRPKPLSRQTRPQWEKLHEFVEQRAHDNLFVIKAFLQDSGNAKGFAGYLRSIGFEAVLLQRESRADDPYRPRSVVDEAICKNLAAVRDRSVDVLVVSHDGDYYDDLEALHESDPDRRIGVVGFLELMSARYSTHWIERIDIERDVRAFGYQIPNRITVTTVDDYDPAASLDLFDTAPALPSTSLPASVDPLAAVVAAPLGQKTRPNTTSSSHHAPSSRDAPL